jgi:hypothetical protein
MGNSFPVERYFLTEFSIQSDRTSYTQSMIVLHTTLLLFICRDVAEGVAASGELAMGSKRQRKANPKYTYMLLCRRCCLQLCNKVTGLVALGSLDLNYCSQLILPLKLGDWTQLA